MRKKKNEVIDGLAPKDIKRLRSACRDVWRWSTPRKLCIARCTDKAGYARCEQCSLRSPKIFVDHIVPVGEMDGGFIKRLFCPSTGLQGLCDKCHKAKTRAERAILKLKKKTEQTEDFY